MSYRDFFSDFNKDKLRSAVFLYGAEDYLINWACKLIIDRYADEEYRDYDVIEFEGDACSAQEIMAASRAYSMFSKKRVIVVRNFPSLIHKRDKGSSDVDEALLSLCTEQQDASEIIWIVDAQHSDDINSFGRKLAGACSSYEFTRLDKAELKGWISKRIHAAGKMIGAREMEYFIELSGYCYKNSEYHLDNIAADIVRIVNASEGEQITADTIEELMVGAEDKFVFNLIDYMMDGNKARAVEMACSIDKDINAAIPVIGLLTRQFEIMYDSVELSDRGMSMQQMVKLCGVNEYRFKKAYKAAKRFTLPRLRELLIKLYNMDRDMKTGDMDVNTAFELFVATV